MTTDMKFDNYTIRLLRADDYEAYFLMVESNRHRLEDYFAGTVSKTKTLDDTKAFLQESMQKIADRMYFPYVIVDDNTRCFIGFIDLKNVDWNVPKSEVGCYMDSNFAGKGIASKALQMFVDHSFETYNFRKLFLRTHPTNTYAIKLAEKCGFEKEGLLRQDYKTTAGVLVDLLYYGQLREV